MKPSISLLSALAVGILLASCGSDKSTDSSSTLLTDSRDGQTYKTVKIGAQRWMAQNLNYASDSSWCSYSSSDSCAKYGRLYQWAAVVDTTSTYNYALVAFSSRRKGLCPSGWHIPSDTEWSTLIKYVDSLTSGTKLKSTNGWYSSGNGTDTFGFSVLPAGRRNSGSFYDTNKHIDFWSITQDGAGHAWGRSFDYAQTSSTRISDLKYFGFSVRCIKD